MSGFARPRVSVVMAAFNAAQTVESAIESVIRQSFQDFELIVVDDGSTDGTATHVLNQYADCKNVRLLGDGTNRGRSAARNWALSVSRGDLIAIMDADDISLPDRLAVQTESLDSGDVDLVSNAVLTFDRSPENPSGTMTPAIGAADIDARIRRGRMPVLHPCSMFRRSWIERLNGYDAKMLWAEDFELVLRGYSYGRFRGSGDPQLLYRSPAAGPTWRYWRHNEAWRRVAIGRATGGAAMPGSELLVSDWIRYVGDRIRRRLRG